MIKFKNVSEIEGFEKFDNYCICSNGQLMNLKKQTFLKGNSTGEHLRYTLNSKATAKTIEAHKLVALAFVEGNFPGAVIDHIDGNNFNNDYRNLQYITQQQNILKANRRTKNSKCYVIALNLETGVKNLFNSITECCRTLNISHSSAYKVRNGNRKLVKNKTYKLYFVEQ